MLRLWLLLAFTAVALSGEAAEECPFPVSDFGKIEEALSSAPTCQAAVTIHRACALRTAGDLVRGTIVQARCERDFAGTLTPTRSEAYKAELTRCSAKIQDGGKRGMDQAMAAGCAVNVAAQYSARALRGW